MVKIYVVLSLLVGIGQLAMGRPSWTQSDSFIRNGDTLRLICNGTGPSLDLARKAAEDSCISTAIRQVRVQITLRSTTISTEKDVALHEEISEKTTVRNLKCYPEREANESRGDTVEVWLLCRFQLDKAQVVDAVEVDKNSPLTKTEFNSVAIQPQVKQPLKSVKSEKSQLTLAIVPGCEDILISGPVPRVVRCSSNPQTIIVNESDEKMTVRARNHLPKVVNLRTLGRNHERLDIILDPK